MPIIYSHQLRDRNQKTTHERKYRNNQWVVFEGKHCQVQNYELKDGIPTYTLKLPTQDGLGKILTVHQRDIVDGSSVTVTDADRQANRDRVIADEKKYVRG